MEDKQGMLDELPSMTLQSIANWIVVSFSDAMRLASLRK